MKKPVVKERGGIPAYIAVLKAKEVCFAKCEIGEHDVTYWRKHPEMASSLHFQVSVSLKTPVCCRSIIMDLSARTINVKPARKTHRAGRARVGKMGQKTIALETSLAGMSTQQIARRIYHSPEAATNTCAGLTGS